MISPIVHSSSCSTQLVLNKYIPGTLRPFCVCFLICLKSELPAGQVLPLHSVGRTNTNRVFPTEGKWSSASASPLPPTCQHLKAGWGAEGKETVEIKMVKLINCELACRTSTLLFNQLPGNSACIWCESDQPAPEQMMGHSFHQPPALPYCFHVSGGLETPSSPPAQEHGGCEAETNCSRLLLCPLCLSPQAPQQREGGFCMNVTFQLVNHMTRKMTRIRFPSGVTCTSGTEKGCAALKTVTVYVPTPINKECCTQPCGLGPLPVAGQRGHDENGLQAVDFCTVWAILSDLKWADRIDAEFNHVKTSSRQTAVLFPVWKKK